jgi:hypothetical protein
VVETTKGLLVIGITVYSPGKSAAGVPLGGTLTPSSAGGVTETPIGGVPVGVGGTVGVEVGVFVGVFVGIEVDVLVGVGVGVDGVEVGGFFVEVGDVVTTTVGDMVTGIMVGDGVTTTVAVGGGVVTTGVMVG